MDTDTTNATPQDAWPDWAPHFLSAFERTINMSKAAEAAGVDRSTAHRLVHRDEAFALAVHDIRERALDLLEETVLASGTHGLPKTKKVTEYDEKGKVLRVTETEERQRNSSEAALILKRWRPEYRESFRIEQTGPGGGPVKHEVTLVDELAAEARAELERLHLERVVEDDSTAGL